MSNKCTSVNNLFSASPCFICISPSYHRAKSFRQHPTILSTITMPPRPAPSYPRNWRRCAYHRETMPPSLLHQNGPCRCRRCCHQWHSRPGPSYHQNQRRCAYHRETIPLTLLNENDHDRCRHCCHCQHPKPALYYPRSQKRCGYYRGTMPPTVLR